MSIIEDIISEAQAIKLVSAEVWMKDNRAINIVLYGGGLTGLSACKSLRSLGFNIVAFSESNKSKWGTYIDGVNVIAPEAIAESIPDAFIIVCFNVHYKTEFPKLSRTLQSQGCSNIAFYGDLRVISEFQNLENPIALGRAILPRKEYLEKINSLYSILSDEKSKDTLVRVLQDRLSLLPQWELPSEQMYFPNDIFQLSDAEVFVDCGAYDGDTLRSYTSRKKDFAHYIAFEPDLRNAEKFSNLVSRNFIDFQNKIILHNKAVYSDCCDMFFNETGEVGGSQISPTGSSIVSCTTLNNEFHSTLRPSYIKIDIEGGEIAALKGAIHVIENCRPKLAISVYHFPHDLWEIPIMLHENFPFYNIFLRAYTCGDIVCYAVPR